MKCNTTRRLDASLGNEHLAGKIMLGEKLVNARQVARLVAPQDGGRSSYFKLKVDHPSAVRFLHSVVRGIWEIIIGCLYWNICK